MKKYISVAALLAAGTMFANAAMSGHWNFDENLNSADDAAVKVPLAGKERQVTTTENEDGSSSTTYSAADSAMTYVDSIAKGTVLGNYTVNKDLNKAVSITDNQWLSVGSAAWSGTEQDYSICPTKSFTFMSYVNFDSLNGEQFLFGTGAGNAAGIAFGIKEGELDLLLKGKNHWTLDSYEDLTANTWMHLAFSYDSETQVASVFVNGDSVGTISLKDKAFARVETNYGAAIGSASQDLVNDSIQGSFAGKLDDVQIYNTALTQSEILTSAGLIPEPSAFGMLAGLGALALVAARRRRK
ncbi:MAG: PEP-CTERM sorting domain-containing protein [Opitutales bacterium]|nr:PEP-CTERM sorting domain-containing protein [Opitutales bacterium]